MDLYTAKALIVFLSIVSRLFFGFTPLAISRKLLTNKTADSLNSNTLEYLVSLCLSLGGGVLLATCFAHLIPAVRESLLGNLDEKYHHYPFTEIIVCMGFFLVYFVEESVKHVVKKHRKRCKAKTTKHCDRLLQWTNGQLTAIKSTDDISSVSVDQANRTNDCQAEQNNNNEMSHVHNLRSLFVVLALSFHSVMEGLAIGLEENMDDMSFLFLAVSIHECTILFCIGMKLATSCSSLTNITLNIIVLALVSPFGIFLGSILTLNLTAVDGVYHTIGNATLQGFAAGTILYVTFFEVLDRERKKDNAPGLLKLLFTMIGFSFMVTLEFIGGHHHKENHLINELNNCSASKAAHVPVP
ncbi:zinc transporter ZIP3-like [Adelges cooleyi]|uniref:zinc transporter ZIP3-like n=1 Tax=Adelges cooleyi TaxID=133065 RepID=UPI0021805E52|nr:zinc transporter ZIP3-like [Adelges cooleyi]XP_050422260.1 zinc transporter ZIP3-like [Adelges cooleyi]